MFAGADGTLSACRRTAGPATPGPAGGSGPVLVNVGEGKLYAIAALAGVLAGAAVFGGLYAPLARALGLPALERGTGDG